MRKKKVIILLFLLSVTLLILPLSFSERINTENQASLSFSSPSIIETTGKATFFNLDDPDKQEATLVDEQGNTKTYSLSENKVPEKKNYIVIFKEESILEKKKEYEDKVSEYTIALSELEGKKSGIPILGVVVDTYNNYRISNLKSNIEEINENLPNYLSKQESKILTQQDKAISELSKLKYKSENIEEERVKNVLNALIVKELDKKEADELNNLPGVETVFEDQEKQIFVDDARGIVNADKLYLLKDSQGRTLTGKGIKVAVLDTGVDSLHPDLNGKVVAEFCSCSFSDGSGSCCPNGAGTQSGRGAALDDHGHGTHVASTIAGKGVINGIAPDAQIYAAKVCGYNKNNIHGCSDSGIISAMEWAADPNKNRDYSDHVDIISMSLGGPGNPDDALARAADNAVNAGVIVIAAAGNSGPSYYTLSSPGVARKAIQVAASCKPSDVGLNPRCKENIASFSSRGPMLWADSDTMKLDSIIKPDISAPGVDICAAQWDHYHAELECKDDKHIAISGTSMATPVVSGVAALLKQAHPDWTPGMMKSSLMMNAADLNQDYFKQGSGLIDALASMNQETFIMPPVLNLGLATSNNYERTDKIIIKNNEQISKKYTFSLKEQINGLQYTYPSELIIPAKSEREFSFTLNLDDFNNFQTGEHITHLEIRSDSGEVYEIPIYFSAHEILSLDLKFYVPGIMHFISVDILDRDTKESVFGFFIYSPELPNPIPLILPERKDYILAADIQNIGGITPEKPCLYNFIFDIINPLRDDIYSLDYLRNNYNKWDFRFFDETGNEIESGLITSVIHHTGSGISSFGGGKPKGVCSNDLEDNTLSIEVLGRHTKSSANPQEKTKFYQFKQAVSKIDSDVTFSNSPADLKKVPESLYLTQEPSYLSRQEFLTYKISHYHNFMFIDYAGSLTVNPPYEFEYYIEPTPRVNIPGIESFALIGTFPAYFNYGSFVSEEKYNNMLLLNDPAYAHLGQIITDVTDLGFTSKYQTPGHYSQTTFYELENEDREINLRYLPLYTASFFKNSADNIAYSNIISFQEKGDINIQNRNFFSTFKIYEKDSSNNYVLKCTSKTLPLTVYLLKDNSADYAFNLCSSQNYLTFPNKFKITQESTYSFGSKTYKSNYEAEFDTSRTDTNPPFVSNILLLRDNKRIPQIDSSKPSKIKIEITDNEGNYDSSRSIMSYSFDGITFTPLYSSISNNALASDVPSTIGNSKIIFRLQARDKSGNKVSLEFEVPVDQAKTTYIQTCDLDKDGFDNEAICEGGDCDDSNSNISPNQEDTCNNYLDDNCDGKTDLCTCEFLDLKWIPNSVEAGSTTNIQFKAYVCKGKNIVVQIFDSSNNLIKTYPATSITNTPQIISLEFIPLKKENYKFRVFSQDNPSFFRESQSLYVTSSSASSPTLTRKLPQALSSSDKITQIAKITDPEGINTQSITANIDSTMPLETQFDSSTNILSKK